MTKTAVYKIVDLAIQLAAIILPWVYFTVSPTEGRVFHLNHLIVSYLIVFVCQTTSCIVNKVRLPQHNRSKGRGGYELALIMVAAMLLISAIMDALILAFMLLLYLSPVIFIWYVVVSIAELVKIGSTQPVSEDEQSN